MSRSPVPCPFPSPSTFSTSAAAAAPPEGERAPSTGASPDERSVLVARLRGAGCVFAEDEVDLLLSAARSPGELAAMVARRVGGLPLEHVVGWVRFGGLRVAVDPGVFVPRRRTEFLVRTAVSLLGRDGGRGRVVVDLCCGSAAVGAAVVAAVGGRVEVHAVDVDPAAVVCARRNLTGASRVVAVEGHVHAGDLYGPLPGVLRGRVDLLVANTPYVPSGEIGLLPPEARVHEPRVALDGGVDGLDVARRVAAGAGGWLAPGGSLLVETSRGQAPAAVEVFTRAGLAATVATCEELSATVVVGSVGASW